MNQCWTIVNWTFRNKLQWNFNRNSNIFIQEIAFENGVCKMVSILSRPQWVNMCSAARFWQISSVILNYSIMSSGPKRLNKTIDSNKNLAENLVNYVVSSFWGAYTGFTLSVRLFTPPSVCLSALPSVCLSVCLLMKSCLFCIFHSTSQIHFIFTHLISQLQKVCHMLSFWTNSITSLFTTSSSILLWMSRSVRITFNAQDPFFFIFGMEIVHREKVCQI